MMVSILFLSSFLLLVSVAFAGNQHLNSNRAERTSLIKRPFPRDVLARHIQVPTDRLIRRSWKAVVIDDGPVVLPTFSRADTPKRSNDNIRKYSLVDKYRGQTFFDNFKFWDRPDPTHGNVNYLNRGDAFSSGLAYVTDDGVAVMKVENKHWVVEGGNRNSVRIDSKKSYGQSLIVMDIKAMPYGCAVWPAGWMNGPDWPNGGEIDVLEGVNDQKTNQYTLHTTAGCHLDTTKQSSTKNVFFTGKILSTDCSVSHSNTGCGIKDDEDDSYGKSLNDAGGSVFATLIDDSGVSIWRFNRHNIPTDLTSDSPCPSTWEAPKARWASTECSSREFFKDQTIIFDITLCGDWAGTTYSQGCPGTCGKHVADPRNFDTARWEINYVAIYK